MNLHVINTGLFKVVKTDDQLAAVIGHETAHVLGKHAAERASQQMAAQGALEPARCTVQLSGAGARQRTCPPRDHAVAALTFS